MAYGWEGERTRLVPTDPDRHLENAVRWLNDPAVTEWLLVGDFPLTRAAEREFLATANTGTEVHFAIETLDGRHIGFSGLHRIDFRHGVATTGSFIGEVDEWGKGYGSDAARVRARYAFETLGLRQLLSAHLGGNGRSRGMLLRAGYEEAGVLPRRFWKRGAYRDEHLFVLEAERWRSLAAG